jgi:hypothetical protein
MQPLFHAVQHGVKAGQVQDAFDAVLVSDISTRETDLAA